jgi:hypothetical protein
MPRRASGTLNYLLQVNFGEAKAALYSFHSFRIGFARSLLAEGCPPATIQALARWRSAESLAIYARTNPLFMMAGLPKRPRKSHHRFLQEIFQRFTMTHTSLISKALPTTWNLKAGSLIVFSHHPSTAQPSGICTTRLMALG